MLDALVVELAREQLGDLDRDRADEHRLALLGPLLYLLDHGGPLAVLGLVDLVVAVLSHHRHVGGGLDHLQLVDLHELCGLGEGRAGHARELVVAAEVVLVGDRGDGLVLLLDRHVLLGLHGLVQTLRPAPALEDAAGELVDDLHLAVDHLVVHAALVERLGLERLLEVVHEVPVLGLVHVVEAEELLRLLDAPLGDGHGLVLLVGLVVEVGHVVLRLRLDALGLLAGLHPRRQLGELVVEVRGLLGGAGDDQRGAGLVDEDVVNLVDDRVVVAALLRLLGHVGGEVVAQVVEPELGVRRVGDVGLVGGALLVPVAVVGLEDADADSQQVVDRLHPERVAAGEVVVHRDQVDALAGERVQRDRQRGGEGLALAGLHLGDRAVVQHHAADQLDVEVALPERALGGLAGDREALVQQVVERLALLRAFAEGLVPRAQLLVRLELHLGLVVVDLRDLLLELLELLALAHAQGFVEQRHGSETSAALRDARGGAMRLAPLAALLTVTLHLP